jgi:rhamnosyltransferase
MESGTSVETVEVAPSAHTTCAVIVTYHPDAWLFDRVAGVVKQVAQTVIVDNGSSPSCVERIREIADRLAVHVILNPTNEGIASALNSGTRWAAARGYRWVLTLDQDTTVADDMIDSQLEVYRSCHLAEKLAIIGSNYRHKVSGRAWLREGANSTCGQEMISVLTSGSLVSIHAYEAIGGFREEFFIDCVDHEFCLRARAHGFHVLITAKPVMEHGIGHLTEHQLLWKKVGTPNHSPARQYFLARNSLILAREYRHTEPRWIIKYLWSWLKLITVIFIFEEKRFLKVKNTIRGCFDGILGRTHWKPT